MTKLLLGDCLDKLKELADESVDSIVSDPPYGLSFMGKKWDYDVPSVAIWRECIRVLKPGGYLLAFAGSRTYHVMAMRIENAGFDICDQLMWIYGSGFPKSHNISKAIDKKVGAKGKTLYVENRKNSPSGLVLLGRDSKDIERIISAPAAPAARIWEGWGTALKPAHEPIVMAQKPIVEDTIEMNVLKHGIGGLNINACRIGNEGATKRSHQSVNKTITGWTTGHAVHAVHAGRWPANIILSEEAGVDLDRSQGDLPTAGPSRFFYVPKVSKRERNAGIEKMVTKKVHRYGSGLGEGIDPQAPSKDNNFHPTIKPILLMEYLIRLVTPPNGIVLDPFMGSGSTGCAAVAGEWSFIGCELSPEYFEIAKRRIAHYGKSNTKTIRRLKK